MGDGRRLQRTRFHPINKDCRVVTQNDINRININLFDQGINDGGARVGVSSNKLFDNTGPVVNGTAQTITVAPKE